MKQVTDTTRKMMPIDRMPKKPATAKQLPATSSRARRLWREPNWLAKAASPPMITAAKKT